MEVGARVNADNGIIMVSMKILNPSGSCNWNSIDRSPRKQTLTAKE